MTGAQGILAFHERRVGAKKALANRHLDLQQQPFSPFQAHGKQGCLALQSGIARLSLEQFGMQRFFRA